MLFPLIIHRRALKDSGITWRCFTSPHSAMFDCDVLIVESNIHGKRWSYDATGILDDFERYRSHVERLCYLDASDSTALLHPEVLPFVDRYYKGQLLADRTLYADGHYGNRLFTDYAHRSYGVEDDTPSYSSSVTEPDLLNKLSVWWNTSLADWSLSGKYRMELYSRIPIPALLTYPKTFTPPSPIRPNEISCRMSVSYARDTVSWYRKTAREKLTEWARTNRVSPLAYARELKSSKIVVSPFGWGEINYKDFETFLAGAALVKPYMSHMETWPNLYGENETYLPYSWDGSDMVETIEEALRSGQAFDIACTGQRIYRRYLTGSDAAEHFHERILKLLSA